MNLKPYTEKIPNTLSRREFLKKRLQGGTAAALAVLFGGRYVLRPEKRIEKQINDKRLCYLTREKVRKIFGQEIAEDSRLQRYNDQLWLDTRHLPRTDQAHLLLQELVGLTDGTRTHVSNYLLQDQRADKFGTVHKFGFNLKISTAPEQQPTKETIYRLFEDLVLYLRDQVEHSQYEHRQANRFGATAGVPSDVNANLLSIHLAKQDTLIDEVYEKYATQHASDGHCSADFRSPQVLEHIFGKDIYQTTPDQRLVKYLGKKTERIPQKIRTHYDGLIVSTSETFS